MARNTTRKAVSKRSVVAPSKGATASEKRLLAEIKRGLAEEKKAGRVPLRQLERQRKNGL